MSNWKVSALISLAVLSLGSLCQAQSPCEEYPVAAKAFAAEKWDDAISGFESRLEKRPDDAKRHFMKGVKIRGAE